MTFDFGTSRSVLEASSLILPMGSFTFSCLRLLIICARYADTFLKLLNMLSFSSTRRAPMASAVSSWQRVCKHRLSTSYSEMMFLSISLKYSCLSSVFIFLIRNFASSEPFEYFLSSWAVHSLAPPRASLKEALDVPSASLPELPLVEVLSLLMRSFLVSHTLFGSEKLDRPRLIDPLRDRTPPGSLAPSLLALKLPFFFLVGVATSSSPSKEYAAMKPSEFLFLCDVDKSFERSRE